MVVNSDRQLKGNLRLTTLRAGWFNPRQKTKVHDCNDDLHVHRQHRLASLIAPVQVTILSLIY
jgi:hypothetical protein